MIKEGNQLKANNGDKAYFHYIVPVFNTPIDLLDNCIYSIVHSLFNASRADGNEYVTIVDDCSDNEYSERIKERIVEQYGINYIRLEKNAGGLFQTRCQALKKLDIYDNDYVCFIDSDDKIEENFHSDFEEYYNKYGNEADIYQCEFIEVKDKYKRVYVNSDDKNDMVNIRWNLSGKFFKKKLFNTAIAHPEVNCFLGEDLVHSIMMYPRVNKIVPFPGTYIYYVRKSKTEEEGTSYRDNETKQTELKNKYYELIDNVCKNILNIENPHKSKMDKVILVLEELNKLEDEKEVYNRLMSKYQSLSSLINNYQIKVCVRSTVNNLLVSFPTCLKADQYMEIKDLGKFDISLFNYYRNNSNIFYVLKDNKLLTSKEWEESLHE